MEKDVRWEQRFSNYRKALRKLAEAVDYIKTNIIEVDSGKSEKPVEALNEIIKEGLIQRFEYTFELAWNVMKDYTEFQGISNVNGSRDSIREALQLHLISSGNTWMDMVSSRIKTVHTYNESTADEIYFKILKDYFPAFKDFESTMEAKRSGGQLEMD